MSEDITNIRKNIRQILRQANSMESEANKDDSLKEYHEHRKKFLTYRNKFERAEYVEVTEKKPFIPDWVKSEQSQPLPIFYKFKGSEVTDIRMDLNQDPQFCDFSRRSINRSTSFADTSEYQRRREYIRQFSKENFSYLKGLYEKNQTEERNSQVQSTADHHHRGVTLIGNQRRPKSVSRFKSLRRSSSVSPPESLTYETTSWNFETSEPTDGTALITDMRNKFLQSLWEENGKRGEETGNPDYYLLPENYTGSMRTVRKNARINRSQIPDLIIDPIKWDHMKVRDNRFLMPESSSPEPGIPGFQTPEFHTPEPCTPEPQESPERFTVRLKSLREIISPNYITWDHGSRINETSELGEDTVDDENVKTLLKEDNTISKMQETTDAPLDELCERILKVTTVPDTFEKSTDKTVQVKSSKDEESRQRVSKNALTTENKPKVFKSKIPLRIPVLMKTTFSLKKTEVNTTEPSDFRLLKSKVVNGSGRRSTSPVNSVVKKPTGLGKRNFVKDYTIKKKTRIPRHNDNKIPVETAVNTKN